jgi:hypothetical protein
MMARLSTFYSDIWKYRKLAEQFPEYLRELIFAPRDEYTLGADKLKAQMDPAEYFNMVRDIAERLKKLAEDFREHFNKYAFIAGYKMTDESPFPYEALEIESIINIFMEEAQRDSDRLIFRIAQPTTPLYAVSGSDALMGNEENLMVDFITIELPIQEHLYWIDRMAFSAGCNRLQAMEAFMDLLRSKWSPKEERTYDDYGSIQRRPAPTSTRRSFAPPLPSSAASSLSLSLKNKKKIKKSASQEVSSADKGNRAIDI